jgi:diguanylate cyclase (GGDEF)-like protein/PAS domain S-box-containing protein
MSLQRAAYLFDAAFTEAPVGMATVELDGSWMRVNRAMCELFGYGGEELLMHGLQELTHPDDLDADADLLQQLIAGDHRSYSIEKRCFTATRAPIWVSMHVAAVRGPEGPTEELLYRIEDITAAKQMELRLKRLADHDPLTNLWNRRRFEEDLQRQVARSSRYGETAALLLLDLDNFKRINDSLGHTAGDDLLCAVAGSLRHRLRTTDALARLGGDEFAVLLANVTADQAAMLADQVVAGIRERSLDIGGQPILPTASIGVAMIDETTASAEAAFMEADMAMYDAKAAGRNRAAVRA